MWGLFSPVFPTGIMRQLKKINKNTVFLLEQTSFGRVILSCCRFILCVQKFNFLYSRQFMEINHSLLSKQRRHTQKKSDSFFFFFSERIHLLTFLKNIFPISLRQIWKSNQKLQALLRWKTLCWGEALWVHPRPGDWWIDYSLYWNQGSRIHCQDDDKPHLWAHRIHNLKQRASIPKTYASPERDTWWERFDRPGWGIREKGKLPWNHTLSSSVWGPCKKAIVARRDWLLHGQLRLTSHSFKRICVFLNV